MTTCRKFPDERSLTPWTHPASDVQIDIPGERGNELIEWAREMIRSGASSVKLEDGDEAAAEEIIAGYLGSLQPAPVNS